MGTVPMVMIERLLVEAELEIDETLCCSVPARNSRLSVWDDPFLRV